MKLKKNDTIRVTAGRDKGREGKVDKVYKNQNKILVAGINIYKKHVKKNDQLPQGGVVEIPRPIDVAKVALMCPKCKRATRVGYKITESKKVRVCRKCDSAL